MHSSAGSNSSARSSPDTSVPVTDLGAFYWNQGKYGQAELLFTKVLEVRRCVLGEEHRSTLLSMGNLTSLYHSDPAHSEVPEVHQNLDSPQRRAFLLV